MDASAGIVTVALFAALSLAIKTTISMIKNFAGGDRWSGITQLLVFVLGILGVLMLVHASFTQAYVIPGLGVEFSSLNWVSVLLLGWLAGGTGAFSFDFLRAIDNSQSGAEPKLGTGGTPPPPAA